MPRSSKTLSKINLSNSYRAGLLKGGIQKSYQGKIGLFKSSRRNFNERIDRFLQNGINKIPNGNLGYLFVGLNTFFYGLYLFWPRDRMYQFLNNFTFSSYNLSRGRLHTLITSHFSHMGFLSYAIDSVIMYLFCSNLQMMFGSLYTAKLAILGIVCGSLLLMLQHKANPLARPYSGNDAIMRALIFTVIFANPTASFYMLPLPIKVPAWAVAALLLGIDFLTFNTAGFGGVTASYLMLNIL